MEMQARHEEMDREHMKMLRKLEEIRQNNVDWEE
jgi:hypothetical protein